MGDLTACPAGVGALYSNWFFVNGNWPQMLRGDDCRLKGIYRYFVNGFWMSDFYREESQP